MRVGKPGRSARHGIIAFLMLAACQMNTPSALDKASTSPMAGDAIATTTLGDAGSAATAAPGAAVPAVTAANPNTPHPKPRPGAANAAVPKPEAAKPEAATTADTPTPDAPPPIPPSPQQVLCEKSNGQWATAGDSGANVCVKHMRDGGKHCSKKTDCSGQCLARSQTCSPIAPMIGCNDVLDSDGRMVTYCLN